MYPYTSDRLEMILVFLLAFFSFTKGDNNLSLSRVDYRGSSFCVAFLQRSPYPSKLKLHILTDEEETVPVSIIHRVDSITINVSNSTITTVEIPSDLIVTPSSLSRNAIGIQTNDPNQLISVLGENSEMNGTKTDVFLAIPIHRYNSIVRYEYAHVSRQPLDDDYSMFVLSNCEDDAVVPFLQSPRHLSGLVPVRDVYRQFADSREYIEDQPTPLRMKEMLESLHFETSFIDMTGIKAWANRPFSFISGLVCSGETCDPFSNQIPPSYTWGYRFSSFPVALANISSYQIKVVPLYFGTYLNYYCSNGTNGSDILTSQAYMLNLSCDTVCSFLVDRPVGVAEILQGSKASGGSMVWIPPVSQYLNSISFPTGLFVMSEATEFVWVAVPSEHFDTSHIKLDGSLLQKNEQLWSEIICFSSQVCEYGTVVQLSEGKHTIYHDEKQGCLSAIVFGLYGDTNYAYPAGFAMDPVGVPIVSFTKSFYIGSESANPNVTLTRSGDVFVAIDIIILISSVHHPDVLPFSADFDSFNATAHFDVGQKESIVSLNVRDDLRVETFENFTLHLIQPDSLMNIIFHPIGRAVLQLQDNDMLILGFTIDEISVFEETEQIMVILQSNIPLQDSGVNILVRTEAGTAADTLDYIRLDDRFFLQPGDSEWRFTVTITNDERLEETEYFFVKFFVVSSVVDVTIANDTVQVNITDTDSVSVHFVQSALTVDEYGAVQILLEKDGLSDLPVQITVNAIENTAAAGVDYDHLSNLLVQFGAEETQKLINVTIVPDSVLEIDETFIVRLSKDINERINFNFGVEAIITIVDDDKVEIGFVSTEVPVAENDEIVILTVEIKQGIANRSFEFHVQTFEQQANEGSDFEGVNKDLVFPAMQSSFNFSVVIVNNDIAEAASEGFTVALTNSASDNVDVAIVEFTRTTVAIKEDDNVLVRMDTANFLLEGREGGPDLKVKLVKSSDIVVVVAVTVFLFVVETNAKINEDFTIESLIQFAPDETEKFATIRLLSDSEREPTESFFVFLSPYSGPVSVDLNQVLTVSIFDTDVTSVEFSSSKYSVVEGDTAVLIISVIGSLNNSISVIVSTIVESANDDDFLQLESKRIVIPAGTTEVTLSIPTLDDEIFEHTENFSVSIEVSPNNDAITGPRSITSVTITDNESVSVGVLHKFIDVFEDNKTAIIAIQRFGLSAVDIPLIVTLEEESAKRGEDFVSSNSSKVFLLASEDYINVSIPIVDDEIPEEKYETFLFIINSLSSEIAVQNGNSTVRITIVDDDMLTVLFNQTNYHIAENANAVLITIISRESTNLPLDIFVTTMDGTAKGGNDYVMLSQTITFNSSCLEHILSIAIVEDLVLEGMQTFFVSFKASSNLISVPFQGNITTVEIIDGPISNVALSISTLTKVIFENDGLALFNVSIIGDREVNVLFDFRTKNGSAAEHEDYIPLETSIVFTVEDSHTTVSVQILDDDVSEVKENFYGTIFSREPAVTILSNHSEIIIRDDEGAVLALANSSYVVRESGSLLLQVERSVDIVEEITLIITAKNGSAKVGVDISSVDDIITIPPGIMFVTKHLTPVRDGLFESSTETFEVFISLPESQVGAIINNDRATVTIVDEDDLIFMVDNVNISELDTTANVCFSSNVSNAIPVKLQLIHLPALTNSALDGIDYNITQTMIMLPKSLIQPSSFCITIEVFVDQEEEPDEYLCLSIAGDNRISLQVHDTTQQCPPQSVTITIKNSGIPTLPICYLEDAMVVTPFPKPLSFSPAYNYHGSCEHVLVQQCSIKPFFQVNVDHDSNDLALSNIAVRINNSFLMIKADNSTYTTQGFSMEETIVGGGYSYDGLVSVIRIASDNMSSLLISMTDLNVSLNLSKDCIDCTLRLIVNATNYDHNVYGNLCGLCGNINGVLLYSDKKNQLTSRKIDLVEDFARSWFVNPEDQIARDSSRDCGVLGNDSVVGDPLYSVPLHPSNSSLHSVSLCFEVHGTNDKVFNLVSDRCVSVNALYSSMINPNDGNIITSIGIKAVDYNKSCVNIVVSLADHCLPVVNSNSLVHYKQFGISVKKHGDKVSVSVPNCENEQLVMWLFCRRFGMQEMLDFSIQRGLNLRSTSHGLIGQFWNIPVKLSSYHTEIPDQIKEEYNPENLYLVTIEDPVSLSYKRKFVGELSKRTWDKSLEPCLYVGSSQGGKLSDIPGPEDSVIEGRYTQYIVPNGLLGTSFEYSRFDNTIC